MKNIINSVKAYVFAHKIISTVGGIILIVLAFNIFKVKTPPYQFIEVKKGTITQEVEVTGRVVPVTDLSLAFEKSGKVAEVRRRVGDRVGSFEAIVILDQADLLAQLAQAKANVAAETANLEQLLAGTRPEELLIKQTVADQASQNLKNSYDNVLSATEGAYLTSNDAVRKQVNDLFTQAESISPQLSFSTYDQQSQIDSATKRYNAGLELAAWRVELDKLYVSSATNEQLDSAIVSASVHLNVLRDFLTRTNDALNKALGLSSTLMGTYKTDLTNAGTQVATAISSVSGASQALKTAKLAYQGAKNDLALADAGSTKEQIDAQRARVDGAAANVQSIGAQLDKTILRAPVKGIVTKQDAKVGQIVSSNVVLVGLISEDSYEIDASIPEVDIGKMSVGNSANITFDALQGKNFAGKVFSIDPAETVIDGAVNFKIKVLLDKADQRVRSGFTANIGIITQKKENVLVLPQFAILQNDQGIFVKKQEGNNFKDYSVTLGIRSKDGMVEILSGVSAGEKVANIGLKSAGQ